MNAPVVDLSERSVRVARAVSASSVATVVALASHDAAGASAPAPMLVLAALVLSWLPAVLLIGRRLSVARQAAVIGVAQFALHGLFTLAAQAGTAHAYGSTHPMPGMPSVPAAPPSVPMVMPAPTPAMWGAHAAAALLTLVLWNRGERVFWGILRRAVSVAAALVPSAVLRPVDMARRAVRRASFDAVPAFHLGRIVAQRSRRGPPSWA
jgi:hypothetical protein